MTPSKPEFDEIVVETVFTDTVSIAFDDMLSGHEIISVTPSVVVDTVNITFTENSVTLQGNYSLKIFDDNVLKYITRGSSNVLEQERVTDDFLEIVPTIEQVFEYQPDGRNTITITYSVLTTEGTIIIPQTVFNNYNIGRDILGDYI